MKVVACERRTGSFIPQNQTNEVSFDNYIFTVESKNSENLVFGKKYEQLKVAVKDFEKYYQKPVNTIQDKDMIFEKDQNNRVCGIYQVG